MSSSLFKQLEQMLAEIPAPNTKTAAEAVGGGEPTGQGATGSDSKWIGKGVDNEANPTAAKPGAFAQELSAEVKALGPGSIDGLPDATPTDPNSIQGCVGLKQTTVGHDPALEDDYVGTQKEPGVGTSTQAKFDDGRKFASTAEFLQKNATDRGDYLSSLANSLLADIATAAGVTGKQAQSTPAAAAGAAQPSTAVSAGTPAGGVKPPAGGVKTAATPAPNADVLLAEAQAGYELARVLGMEKMSVDQRATATVAGTISDGLFDAEMVAAWLHKYASEEDGSEGSEHGDVPPKKPEADAAAPAAATTGQDGAPPEGGASAGASAPPPGAGGGGGDPMADAMSQLGGGGGAPGAPGGGGGMPPGMPGGDPSGGQGGPPGQDGPGGIDGGGPVSKEELLQGLLMAMQELGITPQDVMQAAGSNPVAHKMASAAKEYQRSGKFVWAPAATKRARDIADRSKEMLLELKIN